MSQTSQPWIVVVDDDESQRYATCRVLQRAGYQVEGAATGSVALELAHRGPALVILDVNLPDINGFEVCRRLKAEPATCRIPVLHLSAHRVTTAAKITGLEAGADAYLTQPVEPEELVATIGTLLRARAAEDALRESERSYRLLFESNPLPCWVFANDSLQVLAVNQAAIRQYGYSEAEFLALRIPQLRPEGVGFSRAGAAEGALPETFVSVLRTRQGADIDVEITWQAMRFRSLAATLAVVLNLTERRRVEEANRDAELRRQLLDRVIAVQEEERRSIARELHDETGQLLTSLLVNLRALDEATDLAEAKAHARELRAVTSQAIDEVGRLARGLHPTVLEDLGLGAALARLVSSWGKAEGPEVSLQVADADLAQLAFVHQIGTYRIVQEALTNARKHSRAKRITVEVHCEDGCLTITVRDDGVGFETAKASMGGGLGLQSMRERARGLGGELRIESRPSGTTVRARIPLEGAAVAGGT